MTLNKCLLRLFLGLLALPSSALADCTSPDVPEGSTKYFVADQVFKYCSGTAWVSMGCEMALNEQTRIITTTSASAQNYVVPADWNSSDNRIEVIGAGGSGNHVGNVLAGGGGGGGAYSRVSNVTLTPNGTVSFFINTSGSNTWFGGSSFATAIVAAQGGTTPSGGTGGIGGQAANGIGTVKYSGGSSGICIGSVGGCGGGGAAGPNGDGGHGAGAGSQGGQGGGGANGGSTGVSSTSFTGGAGGFNRLGTGPNNGAGGSGGNGSNTLAVQGSVCTPDLVWTDYNTMAQNGPSSGGGGGGRDNGAAPSDPGNGGDCSSGAGGGGGGVGSSSAAAAANDGVGRQGLIAITYRSATPICTKISACTVARRLYYNATVNSYVVCNGTYEYKLGSADTGIPCTEVGAYKYNVGLAKQTYCDGSFWRSFE